MDAHNKLAKEIRTGGPDEQISLDGCSGSQVIDMVNAAFSTPIPAAEMMRIQFIVGGGKKCRQRYAPDLPKQLSEALREVGFEEDRGASAVLECQGTFKRQHDTDKDLIFMHVFPRVEIAEGEAAAAHHTGVLDQYAPEHLIAVSSLAVFQKMATAKVRSLSQRRRMLKALKTTGNMLAGFEERLCNMQPLDDAEQSLYDSSEQIEAKCEWLQARMEHMVAEGQLTKEEATKMKSNIEEKRAKLEEDIYQAQQDGKAKKVTKLELQRATFESNLAGAERALAEPVVYPLKGLEDIVATRIELLTLEKIANSKQLLDMSQVQKLQNQAPLQEQLTALENAAEEWFQDPELFAAQLQELEKRSEKAAKARDAKQAQAGGWSTVASKPAKQGRVFRS